MHFAGEQQQLARDCVFGSNADITTGELAFAARAAVTFRTQAPPTAALCDL